MQNKVIKGRLRRVHEHSRLYCPLTSPALAPRLIAENLEMCIVKIDFPFFSLRSRLEFSTVWSLRALSLKMHKLYEFSCYDYDSLCGALVLVASINPFTGNAVLHSGGRQRPENFAITFYDCTGEWTSSQVMFRSSIICSFRVMKCLLEQWVCRLEPARERKPGIKSALGALLNIDCRSRNRIFFIYAPNVLIRSLTGLKERRVG